MPGHNPTLKRKMFVSFAWIGSQAVLLLFRAATRSCAFRAPGPCSAASMAAPYAAAPSKTFWRYVTERFSLSSLVEKIDARHAFGQP